MQNLLKKTRSSKQSVRILHFAVSQKKDIILCMPAYVSRPRPMEFSLIVSSVRQVGCRRCRPVSGGRYSVAFSRSGSKKAYSALHQLPCVFYCHPNSPGHLSLNTHTQGHENFDWKKTERCLNNFTYFNVRTVLQRCLFTSTGLQA